MKIPCIFAKSLARRQPCCVLWLQYKKFSYLTKLRSTLKWKFWVQEKAKPSDNANAYRTVLTHYCAKISHFKEILPYVVSAKPTVVVFFILQGERWFQGLWGGMNSRDGYSRTYSLLLCGIQGAWVHKPYLKSGVNDRIRTHRCGILRALQDRSAQLSA